MANNFANINKTNNHLWPRFIENKKIPQHMTLEIHVLAWDKHKNVVGWWGPNPSSPLEICISDLQW
jgi:hypothetical protein